MIDQSLWGTSLISIHTMASLSFSATYLSPLHHPLYHHLLLLLLIFLGPVTFPISHAQDVEYRISEEQQQTVTFIGNVARSINLEAQLPSEVFDSLHYSILAGPSSSGDLFSVDSDTGDLFTARRLDRETLCRFSLQCELDFKVGAVSETYFKNIRVRVLLRDINDNAPRFNRSLFTLEIPESVTVGASFSLEGAVDDDTGLNNSVQSYVLFPKNGPFEVSFTQKLDRTSDVILIIRDPLDREKKNFYDLRLVAADGGVPPQTAEMMVEVAVLDDNDNAPQFTQPSYNIAIGESVRPGENILTISATDEDEGANAAIRYRLSVHQDSSVATLFSVGEVSGQIALQQLPASGKYSVIVQAVDGGSPPKEAQAVVEVNVIDTTNNPPVIVVTLLNTAVSEDSSLKFPVAHVSVEDPDSGSNGQVNCFSQSAYFDLRPLEESDMMVELARSLDREDTATYQVTLFCQDNGSPRLNATSSFTVDVRDVNDNPPVFAQTDITISVLEGDRLGEIIASITATDVDVGENAKLTYSMVKADQNNAFYILEPSGSVVVGNELDRETRDSYVLQIVAVDGGSPALSATATVTVTVEDINDEVPVFSEDSYTFSVSENKPSGTLVGVFNATDPDLGKGGQVSFSLSGSQSQANSAFRLHSNGTLVTRNVLDRESSAEIVFHVVANDHGSPRLSSSRKVKVVLQDINDNKPTFWFPGPSNHSLTLLIPVQHNTNLFTLSVTDADEGSNSVLSYSLASANLSDMFSVDSWTGEVWTKTDLTDDHVGVYNLTFRAMDSGLTPLSSVSSLLLTVKLNPESMPVESSDSNAVIAISIVCATILIAVVVIIIVYLMRKRDRGKKKEDQYVNKVTTNNNKEEKAEGAMDPYLERQNTPNMFFTTASNPRIEPSSRKLSIGFPQEPAHLRKWSEGSPHWDPDPLHLDVNEKDEVDGAGDLQILNRVTSLRLQQAFEHISSIKSQLITGSDTGKPYEWREIHVPGRPEDFNSLSSRGTTGNGDSGLGTDEDGVFINSPPTPHIHLHPPHLPPIGNQPPPSGHLPNHHNHHNNHHNNLHPHNNHHHHNNSQIPPKKLGSRSFSQPASDNSHDTSQQSCSSLPNLYLKPGSDILVFRPTSATSCESSPSMDDNCTTTSGSYSITFEDPPRSGSDRGLAKDFNHVQDVYV